MESFYLILLAVVFQNLIWLLDLFKTVERKTILTLMLLSNLVILYSCVSVSFVFAEEIAHIGRKMPNLSLYLLVGAFSLIVWLFYYPLKKDKHIK